MREEIDRLIKESILNKDDVRVMVLRNIKSLFINFEKDNKELTYSDEVKILTKMRQQRIDSIEQFKLGDRLDLVENEEKELRILNEYIPKEPSEDEVKGLVLDIIEEIRSGGKEVSMRDMSFILKKVQERYATVNGKVVSTLLKEAIC